MTGKMKICWNYLKMFDLSNLKPNLSGAFLNFHTSRQNVNTNLDYCRIVGFLDSSQLLVHTMSVLFLYSLLGFFLITIQTTEK